MRVSIGDVRLFVDIEGPKLVPDGPAMREQPTLVVVHGAPGFSDHTAFRPAFSQLADSAQILYFDLRGGGRSDRGAPERWTLAQWADDLRTLCDTLGIERPVVLGLSAGGFVAMEYATRHPDHPGKLILASTQARLNPQRSAAAFERLGGTAAGGTAASAAALAYLAGPADPDSLIAYVRHCLPLYNHAAPDPDAIRRVAMAPELFSVFHDRPNGIWHRFNLLPELGRIRCPTLVMAGEDDPITPVEDARDIVAALPAHLVRFERLSGCGHGVWLDNPDRALAIIRDFLAA